MRKYECLLLCISVFIISLSFSSIANAHVKMILDHIHGKKDCGNGGLASTSISGGGSSSVSGTGESSSSISGNGESSDNGKVSAGGSSSISDQGESSGSGKASGGGSSSVSGQGESSTSGKVSGGESSSISGQGESSDFGKVSGGESVSGQGESFRSDKVSGGASVSGQGESSGSSEVSSGRSVSGEEESSGGGKVSGGGSSSVSGQGESSDSGKVSGGGSSSVSGQGESSGSGGGSSSVSGQGESSGSGGGSSSVSGQGESSGSGGGSSSVSGQGESSDSIKVSGGGSSSVSSQGESSGSGKVSDGGSSSVSSQGESSGFGEVSDGGSGSASTNGQVSSSGSTNGQISGSASGSANGQVSGESSMNTQGEASGSAEGDFTGNSNYKGQFSKIYAFGDSFTDTGNADALKGLQQFVGSIVNRHLSGHRLSNGKLMIDFLCDSLGVPSLNAYKEAQGNFSNGANFAVAGSTCLKPDFFAKLRIPNTLMWSRNPQSVMTQVEWFNNFLQTAACKGMDDAACKTHIQGSLFWLGAIGFSDYARMFGAALRGQSITQVSVEAVTKFIQAFLQRGAKFLVVQGLPPAGCCPLQLFLNALKGRDEMGCSPIINAMIKKHNELLQQRIEEFRAQYKGCNIVYADTWKAFREIITNHKKFHFQEPFKSCCGAGGGMFNFNLNSLCGAKGTSACQNPQNYISWDGIHYTETMNRQLANLLFNKGFCSPSFDTLIKAKMQFKATMSLGGKMGMERKVGFGQ